ncbi:Diacylglycerol O-acyltransferase 1 [Galdieria sulphuraria]|uniref:O-acyltransferase n=1 Tax=Galdieria sulphuraria TaxID=130081 RepID=M2Y0U2_GALSU|nr:diacylglycerol O-acyltransferase [Galdieria sulphuraria]EME29548.1 diacylglycerol O-acyltransferase [Galdieria sulphuraria]GJD12860.1 Diacylglycerol O-acyltransferase 1 [Galdieria sulphuraria]|eukprot:XP_005706068.1 diacylglycerol O-acyltransferase [Galdieria sulphuraria]
MSKRSTQKPQSPRRTQVELLYKKEKGKQDSLENDEEQPVYSVSRPSIYPSGVHAPTVRKAPLEENQNILPELKSHNLEGLYNLSFFLLIFTLGYNVIRNIREKGWQADIRLLLCPEVFRDIRFGIVVYASLAAYCYTTFFVVKVTVWWRKWDLLSSVLYWCSQIGLYLVLTLKMYSRPLSPIFGCLLAMGVLVFSLKMHSYYATNNLLLQEFRDAIEKKRGNIKSLENSNTSRSGFPYSVNLKDFTYFLLAAPTLVYETNYPRTKEIRVKYILWNLIQLAICFLVQFFLLCQLMLPVLKRDSGSLLFDFMKLAIPSIFFWLLGFYALFHCWLNAWAELWRFGDRGFYRDWWNSTTLDSFWSKWNVPVHEWCLRHIFVESMHKYHVNRTSATAATFLMSAVLHEFIFIVSFKTIRPFMFFGILFQVPLIRLSQTASVSGHRRGNLLVWLNLFMGHPLIELLYFRSFFQVHHSLFCVRV